MRSFAFWYDSKSEVKKQATINVNLWDNLVNSDKHYNFDFGFMIEDIENIDKIFLYVPFSRKDIDVKDLGKIISKGELASAIFNENLRVETSEVEKPKRAIFHKSSPEESFVIYALESKQIEYEDCLRNSNISSEYDNSSNSGTIIILKTHDLYLEGDCRRYYFRIRINVQKQKVCFINDEVYGKNWFNIDFNNTEIIDFRLNDIRSCSPSLREQFNLGKKFELDAIHYLILRNASDEIVHYGKPFDSRVLESNLWKDYINVDKDHIIAYHIKSKAKTISENGVDKKEPLKEFNDMTRFKYRKSGKILVLKYVVIIIALGTLSSLFATIIQKAWFPI